MNDPSSPRPCGCPELGRATLSRRSFLKVAGLFGLVAGLAAEGRFTRLAFGATPSERDILVVLSLRGGFDGLNAIVPAGDPYYATWRPNIGIPPSALIPLDRTFGLHPALAPLRPLWDAGTFGVVHAVGQAEPNRSHFEAMEEMERAAPGTSLRTGWIDRLLGLQGGSSPFQGMQVGGGLAPTSFLGPAPELAIGDIDGFGLDAAWDEEQRRLWRDALLGMHAGAPDVLRGPTSIALDALDQVAALREAGYTPEHGAAYPEGALGNALRDVARLIKADVGLQVAAVDYGDWDMHAGMGDVDGGWMRDHLAELAAALVAFATDLGPRLSGVTLVTLTEFGRRVEENGSGGTDHGFGQAVLLLGGGVVGGRVHGAWPGLAPDRLLDGDLDGVNDYRVVLAEILEKRCGAGSIEQVFPGAPRERLGLARARS
jgi:uncharacterized protein (DUF1501 family)